MKLLPHNFILSPVTNEQYCSNCGIAEQEGSSSLNTGHCLHLSHAEQVRMMQRRWFEGYNERMLERLYYA